MKKLLSAGVETTILVVAAGPAPAHHSSAMFDYSHFVTVSGTIKSYSYKSPQAWISIVGNERGKIVGSNLPPKDARVAVPPPAAPQ